jgi:methionine synthase I (cobalamin-dependent)
MSHFESALRERVLAFHTGTTTKRISSPELDRVWYRQLVDAGTDALETDTLNSDVAALLDPSGLRREPIRDAVALARNVATPNDRFVVGAVWVGFSLTLAREVSFDQVASLIAYQVRELSQSGADAVHLPWVQDSMDLMAALDGIKSVEQELGCRIPLVISFDVDPQGTLLSGERPEDMWGSLRPYPPVALGLVTYGYGADQLRRLRDVSQVPVGMFIDPFPWCTEVASIRPIEWIAECLGPLLDAQLLSFCGLSCTIPSIDYIRAVSDLIRTKSQA